MAWVIDKFRSLNPTRCALVWYERGKRCYAVAVFTGAEGQEAAERILADLEKWDVAKSDPDPWNSAP